MKKKIPLYFFLSFAFFQNTMEKEILHSKDEKSTIKDLFYLHYIYFTFSWINFIISCLVKLASGLSSSTIRSGN